MNAERNEEIRGATPPPAWLSNPVQTPTRTTQTHALLLKWLSTGSIQSCLNSLHTQQPFVSRQSHPWRRAGWSGNALECTAVATALKVASDCWHRSPATWKTRSQHEHVLTDTTGTQASFADQENFDQVLSFGILTLEVFSRRTWPEMTATQETVNDSD